MWVEEMFNYHRVAAELNEIQIPIPFMWGEGENKLEIYAFWMFTTQFSTPADQMQGKLT